MKTRADQKRLVLEDAKRRELAKLKLPDSPRYTLDCVATNGCKVTIESRTQ